VNLSLQDCIALSDLTDEEIAAIAEHEHIPEIVAAELGSYLVHSPDGIPMLKRMIVEDIEAARRRGDLDHCLKLRLVLHHFIETHPEVVTGSGSAGGDRRSPG
jgi:hypothetical protein